MDDSSEKLTRARCSARPDGTPGAASADGQATDPVPKGIALYHDMRVEEDFNKCATRLFSILKNAAAMRPGAPRHLYLDIQGHRNSAGGYDADALEIMQEYLMGFLGPYLTGDQYTAIPGEES